MGGADDDVTGLDGVDHLAGGGEAGVGGGDQRGDDAHRLGVFYQTLLGVLLDDSNALLAQAVPEDQLDLVALVALGHLVAQAGLVHGLVGQLSPHLHVAHGGGHGLTQPVYPGLVIGGNDVGGLLGAGDHLVQHLDLFRSNFFCHNKSLLIPVFCAGVVSWLYCSPPARLCPIPAFSDPIEFLYHLASRQGTSEIFTKKRNALVFTCKKAPIGVQ